MPPPTLEYAPPPSIDLPTIAARQRAIILCILVYICCIVAQFVVPQLVVPQQLVFIAGLGLVMLATMVTAVVFVFMLATKIYSTGVGVLLGILTLIPLIGLIVLLIVNGKATKILKANGYKVGLLGATPPQWNNKM